jgi:hypothetical protein
MKTKLVSVALCATVLAGIAPAILSAADSAPGALHAEIAASREKAFGDSPVIIVPTVVLKLPVAGKVSVAKQGSALSAIGGGNVNTVKASAHFTVDGLDKAMAQSLARKVYDDFVGRLRAAGYTVKTYEDIKDMDVVKAARRDAPDAHWGLPLEKDGMGTNVFVVATPSDEQAFKSGLAGGVFNPFMKLGKSTLGEGTILMPSYTIAAPQVWGEKGSGYKTISAGVNAAPGMNLMAASVPLLTSKGGWGDAHLKGAMINIGENVGELTSQDTTSKGANAFSSALSMLTGAGKITGKSANYVLKVNPAAYEESLLRGVSAFHEEVAKVIAAAKK